MKNEKRRMKNYGIPVCGARKTLRAYADPCVFRPLHKLPSAFLCPRQRRGAIPRSGMIEIRRRRRHLNFSFFILHFSFPPASRNPGCVPPYGDTVGAIHESPVTPDARPRSVWTETPVHTVGDDALGVHDAPRPVLSLRSQCAHWLWQSVLPAAR